jgi:hypothetical protein
MSRHVGQMPAPIKYTLTADPVSDALALLSQLQADLRDRKVATVNTALLLAEIRHNLQKYAK